MFDIRTYWPNWPRWLAGYAGVIALGTLAISTTVGQYDLLQSFLATNFLVMLLLPMPVALAYGRIKYRTVRGRRCFYGFMAVATGVLVYVYGDIMLKAGSVTGMVPKTMTGLMLGLLLLTASTVAMFVSIADELRRDARQQATLAQAELKLLQAQVEPHFLFNTLANLRHLVQTGSPEALAMLDHLVHYLRTALPDIRTPGSTVGRETELARAYLEIMRIRMGGALEFTIDVAPEAAAEEWPPLMLMTLVENAVKHGVAPRGNGRIAVQAARDAKGIRVVVEDDGPGLTRPLGRGVGLANVRERLRALYGGRARLDLEQREPAGMRAVIEIAR
jgi:LytS/YehU family sensor histidine kinase